MHLVLLYHAAVFVTSIGSCHMTQSLVRSLAVWLAGLAVISCSPLYGTDAPEGAIHLLAAGRPHAFVSSSGETADWPSLDGTLVSTPNGRRSNNLVSRLHFRDAEIHVEFLLPTAGDANSGIYLHGLYEVQILASHQTDQLTAGDLGGIYSLHAPRVYAGGKPGEWQSFDLRFHAPTYNSAGDVQQPGELSVWLNGRQIHDRVPLGTKTSQYNPLAYDTTKYLEQIQSRMHTTKAGPLILQDHDSSVRFRNIWVKPLDDAYYRYDSPAEGELPCD